MEFMMPRYYWNLLYASSVFFVGITYIVLRHAVRIDAAIFRAPLPVAKHQKTECFEERGFRAHQAALLHALAGSMRLTLYVRSTDGSRRHMDIGTRERMPGCAKCRCRPCHTNCSRTLAGVRTAVARSLGYALMPLNVRSAE